LEVDPDREVTVCCGSTEGMISTLMALCNAGDEVIIFEPFYENYRPDTFLSGAKPQFVKLRPPSAEKGDWTFDERELRAAFRPHTKAIILNTPNNPTGKVFTREELELMRERTVTINSVSKTFSVTGWRVGWVIAPPAMMDAIRKVHDFLTVNAPTPLQEASAIALAFPRSYYQGLAAEYRARRDRLVPALKEVGFHCFVPKGAYYAMADISKFGFSDDFAF